jgi:hypothetical protein
VPGEAGREASISIGKTSSSLLLFDQERNPTPARLSIPSPRSEAQGENSPKQILSSIEPMNFGKRTERRSVTCSSEIFHKAIGKLEAADLQRCCES